MQIVCPRCRAMYDVPESALSAPGRDVQCAACNHGWFHLIGSDPQPAPTAEAPSERARAPQAQPVGETFAVDSEPTPRREIAPDVLKILREEAAYEAARRKEAASSRPERDAVAAPRDPEAARKATVARTTGARVERPVSETAENSEETWSPRNLPVAMSEADRVLAETRRQRRGFRAGFAVTAGAACLALVLYIAAPSLARTVPAMAQVAETIVAQGDRLQAGLASLVQRTIGEATNG